MKQLIVLMATVLLGIGIFHLIMGPQDSSIFSTVKSVWDTQIELRTQSP